MTGGARDPKILPFRGDYLILRPEKAHLVKGNIYPVPDPEFPFLGVHFTPRMNGEVWLGPNAVLAFAREGYSFFEINPSELWDALTYPGFSKIAAKFWKIGAGEMYRDLVRSAYVRALQRYIPELQPEDCLAGPAGVRAQAMAPDGSLVDDFVFEGADGIVHVLRSVEMDAEREVRRRLEFVERRFETNRVRAEIDELLALDEFDHELIDLRMQQRFAAGDGDDGRTALIDSCEHLLEREMVPQHFDRMLNLAAAVARKVAAEERFEHQNERILVAACETLPDHIRSDACCLPE